MKLESKIVSIYIIAFYLALFFSPDKKILAGICVIALWIAWKVFGSFQYAIGMLFFLTLPIVTGKKFSIDLLSIFDLDISGRSFGIGADIVISPSDILVVAMGIVLIYKSYHHTLSYVRHALLEWCLFLYPVGVLIATFFGSIRPEISVLHALFALKPFIIYYFFSSLANFKISQTLIYIAFGVIFESLILGLQVFHRGPIGLVVEQFPDYYAIDLIPEVEGYLLRHAGTYSHANTLGFELLIPILLFVPTVIYRIGRPTSLYVGALLLSIASLIFTMSRSAWISVLGGITAYMFVVKRVWHEPSMVVRMFASRFVRIGIIVVFILSIRIIFPRIVNTVYTIGEYGSVETRLLLFKEYSQTIRSHFWFGVGLETDVYYQYLQSRAFHDPQIDSPLRSVVLYFPEPIHNGILRMLTQVGIISVLPYIGIYVCIVVLLIQSIRASHIKKYRHIALALICALVATAINSTVQPLLPNLSLYIALSVIWINQHTV